ncbi:hypothetical protein J3R30DRAFT_3702067 [Lentinula aciculospora]|uniref:Uncharacterized protein n=1 Tax=Lentinula aciculospora TaxID=153920 RepID=A0A9W9AE96_9AGAR|nr:hypothetical protein J3R30DRAFT_3702067 [Lentinula aciculospora]
MSPEVLTEWLTCVPRLSSLQLNDMGCPPIPESSYSFINTFRDLHLSSLTPSHENPTPFCPKLTTFRLINNDRHQAKSKITSSALLGFAQARASTLQSLDVFFNQDQCFAETDLDTLRELKKEGLKIRLHYAKHPPLGEHPPSTGLYPRHIPRPPGFADQTSDMEGAFGTDYIV